MSSSSHCGQCAHSCGTDEYCGGGQCLGERALARVSHKLTPAVSVRGRVRAFFLCVLLFSFSITGNPCTTAPSIENAADLSHCAGVASGYACQLQCQAGFIASEVSIPCFNGHWPSTLPTCRGAPCCWVTRLLPCSFVLIFHRVLRRPALPKQPQQLQRLQR